MRINSATCVVIALFIVILAACPRLTPKTGARTDNRGDDIEGYVADETDPGRDAWQKPDEVINSLLLKGGETVADVGAGAGYFTFRLAEAVGPEGTVYAAESQPDLLLLLAKLGTERGFANVKIVKSAPHDPQLPFESVELAMVCNNLSRVDLVYTFFDHLRRSMKPKGRVAIIDWRENSKKGPEKESRRNKKEIIGILQGLGFEIIKEYDFLPYQYFIVFMLEERYG